MSNTRSLQPTKYAYKRYKIAQPIDFDVGVNYAGVLMAIAGADGELADEELQWYIDEQERLFDDPSAYIEAVRKLDWKNIDIDEKLLAITYDFPLNFRRTLLYQAIKMTRADGVYQERERAAVAKAAAILRIEPSVLASLESVAEMEDAVDRLRLSLFET